MKIKNIHSWNIPRSEVIDLQKKLAQQVKFTPLNVKNPPMLVAGLDCAFSKDMTKIIAVAIVLKLPDFEIIETKSATKTVTFPYISGLLSFREAPVCIQAAKKLKTTPDIFLIDGQGIAHPRKLGLAAHLGLFFDIPTIGCAKSRLTGKFTPPPQEKGSSSPLILNHQTIGTVLRTRTNVKPIFVSVGNKCTLQDAVNITLKCAPKYRIPEPTRLAHQLVSKLKLTI